MPQITKHIVQGGYSQADVSAPVLDSGERVNAFNQLMRERERQYEETNDFYDLQREEAQSLSQAIEGLKGKDYTYIQDSIIGARDRLKALYKGRTVKDYNKPEFQSELFKIKSELMNARNGVDTFYDQATKAQALVESTPYLRRGRFRDYLLEQMSVAPDKRDKDILNKVASDPLFFNPYDYVVTLSKEAENVSSLFNEETKDLILNKQAQYNPELGEFENGKWTFNPSNNFIKKVFETNPLFKNAMLGMLPPDRAKAMADSGNGNALEDAVMDQARSFIGTVKELEPSIKQVGKTVKTWEHYRPTASQTKESQASVEAATIQGNLQNGDERAFDDYLGDHWQRFEYESDGQGNINKIIGVYMVKNPRGVLVEATTEIPVDVSDTGSVAQARNRIKFFAAKDKKQVQASPLSPGDKGNINWREQIKNME